MQPELNYSRGDQIADKYEIVDLLDGSPLGVTYRVKHLKTGTYVRLVLLRPRVASRENKDALVEAFRRAKGQAHPHLVKVGELGEHRGAVYFTYEDFEGTTLRELFRKSAAEGRSFEGTEAAQITQQILDGLVALHESGTVLRALRPELVLVAVRYTGPRRTTFVAHCKIVAPLWELVDTTVLAEDDFTRGDIQYVAPELRSAEPTVDGRADVYSAGMILAEALAGEGVEVPSAASLGRPDLPPHLLTVLELALAPSPEDRYPSGSDFATDLARTFEEPLRIENGSRTPLASPVALAVAFALVATTAIVVLTSRRDPQQDAKAADAAIREQVYREIEQSTPTREEFERMYARHPPNMVYLPPGPFVAGRLHDDPFAITSEPLAERRQTRGFLIDLFEYPNLEGAVPRYDVTWDDAARMCEGAGKRLCTADEWERACKGARSLVYSYGDTYDPEFCGAGLDNRRTTGTAGQCRSEYGVFDLSGNFREWTGTSKKAGRMIVKGGLIGAPEKGTRCAQAEDESSSYTDRTLSFRCCRDADAPPVPETSASLTPTVHPSGDPTIKAP